MKVYPKTISLFASAALLTFTSLSAVETDPVGYVSVDLPDQSDVRFAVPLTGPVATSGTILSVSEGIATVSSTQTADQYNDSHYLLFTSGVQAGQWFQVTDTDTNIITTAENLATLGVAAADTYKVFPFWTLDSLLPNGGGIPASSNAFGPVALLSTNDAGAVGINLTPTSTYVYLDATGAAGVGGSAGWYDNSNPFAGSVSPYLTPESYLTVRNTSGASSTIVLSGAVPVDPLGTQIGRLTTAAQDNLAINPYPVAITLNESGLFESGSFEASSNAFGPTDLLFIFQASDTGINATPSVTYIYLDATGAAGVGGSAGWYDNSNPFAGAVGDLR